VNFVPRYSEYEYGPIRKWPVCWSAISIVWCIRLFVGTMEVLTGGNEIGGGVCGEPFWGENLLDDAR
jgi:hypothetical protein